MIDSEQLNDALAGFIARQVGAGQVIVDSLERLSRHASHETWSLDAIYQQDGLPVRLPLVLRCDASSCGGGCERRNEFFVLRAAQSEGIPVPRVYWLADESQTLGVPFLLMERVEPEAGEGTGGADAVGAIETGGTLGRTLARIHRLDWRRHGLDFLPGSPVGDCPARAALDRCERWIRSNPAGPPPPVERAIRWLREAAPQESPRKLVHGDFRAGNLLFEGRRLSAVVGWGSAHVGDPREDLGWASACLRRESAQEGDAIEREVRRAYEDASGECVDAAGLRFWEGLALVRLIADRTAPSRENAGAASDAVRRLEDRLVELTRATAAS